VLPAAHRLRRSPDFTEAVRGRGAVRSGGRRLVVHMNRRGTEPAPPDTADAGAPPRVGFVVSKAVGNAVVRNRTKRVLRHLVAHRLDRLAEAGAVDVVVRANPAAAGAATADLAGDLDHSLDVVLRKLADRAGSTAAGRATQPASATRASRTVARTAAAPTEEV
jgi:ribonuclease P protein component